MRKLSSRIVLVIGRAWMCLGGVVVLIGYASTVYFHGFGALQEMLDPFGGHAVINMIAVGMTLAPGFILTQLAEAIEHGQRKRIVLTLLLFPIAVALAQAARAPRSVRNEGGTRRLGVMVFRTSRRALYRARGRAKLAA